MNEIFNVAFFEWLLKGGWRFRRFGWIGEVAVEFVCCEGVCDEKRRCGGQREKAEGVKIRCCR